MGFLDEIKNKMHLGGQQGYDQGYGQDDDYGYDDGYDDGYQNNGYSGASGEGFYTQDEPSNGLLGQTRRGEAESVAVYTRSGQLVGDDSRHATTYNPPSRSQDSVASGYRPGAYDTPSSYAENTRARAAAAPAPAPSDASAYASNIINATPQLPAYVLRPESYDDVETVVRRVRTKQPVALIFVGVRTKLPSASWTSLTALPAVWVPRSRRWATACSWCCPPVARSKIPISRSFVPTATLSKDKTRRFPSTSTLSSSWSTRCSTSIPRSLSSTAL